MCDCTLCIRSKQYRDDVKEHIDKLVSYSNSIVEVLNSSIFNCKNNTEEFKYNSEDPNILDSFTRWYINNLKNGKMLLMPIFDSVSRVGTNSGIVVYRNEQLQVQLWMVDPSSNIVEHTHPNVESYEVYFGSQMYFMKEGKLVLSEEDIINLENNFDAYKNKTLYDCIKINTDTKHSGYSGPKGGAFLSIQHWKNGIKPSSVEKDWDGNSLGKDHIITSS
jgi:hypothetical protein